MKPPDAKERLREKYRKRYANRMNDTGAADGVIRQRRLDAIAKKLREGVAETKEKDE